MTTTVRVLEWVETTPPRRNFTGARRASERPDQYARLAIELRKQPTLEALILIVPKTKVRSEGATLRRAGRKNGFKIKQRETEDGKTVRFYAKAV